MANMTYVERVTAKRLYDDYMRDFQAEKKRAEYLKGATEERFIPSLDKRLAHAEERLKNVPTRPKLLEAACDACYDGTHSISFHYSPSA